METTGDALRREYEELARRSDRSLTAGQNASLRYFTAERGLAEGKAVARNRIHVTKWVAKVWELEKFVADNSRQPRQNNRAPIPKEERGLAYWVRSNRQRNRTDALTDYQRRRLETVPGFMWAPLEDAWSEKYSKYQEFLRLNGAAPRLRAVDESEKMLAAWAAKQRLAQREGRLSVARRRRLESLPIWTWG